MNKQRYLAELQRLLVFMTEEDRAETIRRYTDLFDAAGPEGEAALLDKIGSPTKAAISLSRGYEPGQLAALPMAPEEKKRPAALTETQDDPWGDLPAFDLPDYLEEDEEDDTAQPERQFSMPDLPGYTAPVPPAERPTVTRSMPLGLGVPLFVLVIIGLGIPLAAALLAVMAALLVPGCAGFFGAYLTAVGGLWCLSYMADAILLFGAAFIVLALGIVLLFGGVWLDVKLTTLYIRGLRWVAGELLGRRVTEDD